MVTVSLYSLACLCRDLRGAEPPSVSSDHKHFGVILFLLRYHSHSPPRDNSLPTCLQQHFGCQGTHVLAQAGAGLLHPGECWQALNPLPCLQRLLPASAVPEGEQTPGRLPTSNWGCCAVPQGLHHHGHEPHPHYFFPDGAQHAHRGHLSICAAVLHNK